MIPFTSHTFQGKSLIILKKLFWEAKYPVMACLQKNAMNFSKKDMVFKIIIIFPIILGFTEWRYFLPFYFFSQI